MPQIASSVGRIRPPVFGELQARIDRMGARGAELLPLQIGDTWLAPPAAATALLASFAPDDAALHRYGATVGLTALREAFVATQERALDSRGEVLVANGGTHALFCGAKVVLDPGDEVVLASPYWPLAPGIFAACGARPVDVPLMQRLYEEPGLDPRAVLEPAIGPRTKAIYFVSPNNPDGKVLTSAQLASIARLAVERDLWVFADEAYAEITYDAPFVSIAAMPGMRERTLTVHSIAKSRAFAGLRVGFLTAPAEVIALARRVSTHSVFNVSEAMQRVAAAALSDRTFPARARAAYREARDRAAAALAGAPIAFHVPEGATYLFLDFTPAFAARPDDVRPLYGILERAVDRGVLLAPGEAFGEAHAACARLCFSAAPAEKVEEGARRLRDAVDAWQRGAP